MGTDLPLDFHWRRGSLYLLVYIPCLDAGTPELWLECGAQFARSNYLVVVTCLELLKAISGGVSRLTRHV
jgi:hypothetical protein